MYTKEDLINAFAAGNRFGFESCRFVNGEIEETIERNVTIVHECRKLGKIIQIENIADHLIPSAEE